MLIQTLFLAATFISNPATPLPVPDRVATVLTCPVGGPPSIRLAKKAEGAITAVEWGSIREVELIGCVPGARITKLTICIKDCNGKDAMLSTGSAIITKEMRTMVQNLPAGTAFTVHVEVKDKSEKNWKVPSATFTWKG